jgi:hypothetical protein
MHTFRATFFYGIAALCAIASSSFAREYGVIDGATLTWAPQTAYSNVTNYDQVIRIDDGAVAVQGTVVNVPGIYAAVAPLGGSIPGVDQPSCDIHITFETTPTGASTSLEPSTSYYVYVSVGSTQSPNMQVYIISKVPPWADGYPSSTVYYTQNQGGGCEGENGQPQVYNESSANSLLVYLGSFITGANGRMVGFNRTGEQVFLDVSFTSFGVTDQQFSQSITFPVQPANCGGSNQPACGYPAIERANFPGIVPATATALIVDLIVSPQSVFGPSSNQPIYLLDPQLVPTINAKNCSVSNVVQTLYLTNVPSTRVVAPIAQTIPTLNFGVCYYVNAAGLNTSGSFTVIYQGYVEPTHHLTFVHP